MKRKYILNDENHINGIKLNARIKDEELYEYSIIDREEFIDTLINWISEATKDRELMKQDLKMLMNLDCDYLFSSNSTNSYITEDDAEFENICEDLIELSATLDQQKQKFKVETSYVFKGYFEVLAKSEEQAKQYVNLHCGCVLSGDNPHSSLPDNEIDWEFNIHPDKVIIEKPIKID